MGLNLVSLAREESRNISENVKWGKKKKAVDGYSQLGYSNLDSCTQD
jgi:hypothetical protein